MEKRITVVCFSPTGTSAEVARAIAGGIRESCASTIRVLDVTFGGISSSTFGKDDIVVIAAPVYGGHFPKIAAARMEGLKGNATPAVLVAVYGNRAFEKSLSDMESFVVSRGFVAVAAAAFIGEHSYSTPATPIAEGRPDREDLNTAHRFGVEAGEKIIRGDITAVGVQALHEQPSASESIANFQAFVKEYQHQQAVSPRILIPRTDASLCVHCGKCVALCPACAIDEGREEFTDAARCIKCCACVKGCPQDARTLTTPFASVLAKNFSQRKQPVYLL